MIIRFNQLKVKQNHIEMKLNQLIKLGKMIDINVKKNLKMNTTNQIARCIQNCRIKKIKLKNFGNKYALKKKNLKILMMKKNNKLNSITN